MSHESKLCGTALAQLCYAVNAVENGHLRRVDIQKSFSYGMEVIHALSLKMNISENTLKDKIYAEFVSRQYNIQSLSSWLQALELSHGVVVNQLHLDTKRKLQEYLQQHGAELPKYFYRKQGTRFHAFCECSINGTVYKTKSIGKNQKSSSRLAAEAMLNKINT